MNRDSVESAKSLKSVIPKLMALRSSYPDGPSELGITEERSPSDEDESDLRELEQQLVESEVATPYDKMSETEKKMVTDAINETAPFDMAE